MAVEGWRRDLLLILVSDLILAALLGGVFLYVGDRWEQSRWERERELDQVRAEADLRISNHDYFRTALAEGWAPNFRGFDLSGFDLTGTEFPAAVKMDGANLNGTVFAESTFGFVDISGPSFMRADMREAVLEDAVAAWAWFGGADLSDADASRGDPERSPVQRRGSYERGLSGSRLDRCDVRRCPARRRSV